MEAADDIAYSAADIEDGIKLGIIGVNDIKDVFSSKLKNNKDTILKTLDELDKEFDKDLENRNSLIVQKFRIETQRIMIESIIKTFEDKYDLIMNGELEDEIIKVSDAADIREAYKKLTGKIFKNQSILKKELAGKEAIEGLLQIFVNATESVNFKPDGNTYESRLYNIISPSFRTIYERHTKYPNDKYNRLRLVVDYISGMTDRHVISLYQELKGIKL